MRMISLILSFVVSSSLSATTFREVSEPQLYEEAFAVCVGKVRELSNFRRMNMIWTRAKIDLLREAGGCLKGTMTNPFSLEYPGGQMASGSKMRTTMIPGGVRLKASEEALFFISRTDANTFTLAGWKHLPVSSISEGERKTYVLTRSLRRASRTKGPRALTELEDLASFKAKMERGRSTSPREPASRPLHR